MIKQILALLLLTAGTALWSEERGLDETASLSVYRDARSDLLGRSYDRSRTISIPLVQMRTTETNPLSIPVPTALLIRAEVLDFLKQLTEGDGEGTAGEIAAQRIGQMSYRIRLPKLGIDNSYRFEIPSNRVYEIISAYYDNIYWEEEVLAAYTGNYTITVLAAEDLTPPYNEADFIDAILAATLIADKEQPLWGIHDGLGLIDGLGYSLIESGNKFVEATTSYREPVTNRQLIQDIVLRLRRNGAETPSAIRTLINSMVQFEVDGQFLLPEELLFEGQGDCLELALTYYDLLRRSGYEARILALRQDSDEDLIQTGCEYVTAFQLEEFGPWGFLTYQTYGQAESERWEEIPARVMKDNVFFYPIDAERTMLEGPPDLPPLQAWSLSIY